MTEYILPIGVFLLLGGFAGAALTFASKVFFIKTDDRIERIGECLPGINCGACGFSGCEGYAEQVAAGNSAPNLCKPGGTKSAQAIGEILGITVETLEREVAYVRCNGNCDAHEDKFIFTGIQSCNAVGRFYNGTNDCGNGCCGKGDCVSVCDYGALSIVKGIAVVNPGLCAACEKCIAACPDQLIALRRVSERIRVVCRSEDSGKITRKLCKNGCIACKICEKKCAFGAIRIENNHAVIDGEKCTNCGVCIDVCPVKCIAELPGCVNN